MKQRCMKATSIIVLLAIAQIDALCQSISNQVIASAGQYSVGANASLSSTTGEACNLTFEADGWILTQGFQQPTEASFPVTMNEVAESAIQAYPNPVSDLLTITSSNSMTGMLLRIIDASGKCVYSKIQSGTNYIVFFSSFANGLYLLQVLKKNGEIQYQTKLTHIN